MPKARSHDDYTVGWICALPLEMAAAKARLDELHPPLAQPRHDHNSYTLGAISGHNIAIACLPSGIYGTTSAAVVADQMQSTFGSIRFGLLVGIGGGVPSQADIRLGDIVVSKPTGTLPGIVQYDYGKSMVSGQLKRTGTQNLPPHELLTAMAQVESNHIIGKCELKIYLEDIISPNKDGGDIIFQFPGKENDALFNASYEHEASLPDCSNCDRSQLEQRKERSFTTPKVHYGTIASGNQVMKDGRTRDSLAQELGILCFEMEAAGLMNHFPCLVIRGICDYSDSHKNKDWQGYAAITAAVYAKVLLSHVPLKQLSNGQSSRVQKAMGDFDVRFSTIDIPRIPYFVGREQELVDIPKMLQDESSDGTVVLQGLPGIGKTQLAVAYILQHRHEYSGVFWLDATDPTTLESSFVRMARRIYLDHPSESFIKALIDANDMEQLQQMTSWDKMKLVVHRLPEGRSRKTPDDQKLSDIVYAMITWLSKPMNNRWLVVYDNYDAGNWPGSGESRDRIKAFLSDSRQGHVLITTRISDICTGHLIRAGRTYLMIPMPLSW
ncbi:hypothetical protein MW887_003159 [Aspergillus wentii]|nr:hypothetical protein MW887_003159 [Aspergillus wentii]